MLASQIRLHEHALRVVTSHANWLMASLLTLNGAALAFVVSHRSDFGLAPAATFGLGLLAALGIGVFQWLAARIVLQNLADLINPFQIVDKRYAKTVDPEQNKPALLRAKISVGFGFFSLFLLVVGGLVSACKLY